MAPWSDGSATGCQSYRGELDDAAAWYGAVCRWAERRLTTLRSDEDVSPDVCTYLNRLGDLLFILARSANHVAGAADIIWAPRA